MALALGVPRAWILAVGVASAVALSGGGAVPGLGLAAAAGLVVLVVFARAEGTRRELRAVADALTRRAANAEAVERTLDAVPAVLWRADASGARQMLSPAWYAVTGQAREEAEGDGWIEMVHPDDRERCRCLQRLYGTAAEPYESAYRVRRPDDSFGWVSERGAPEFDDRGSFRGFVGIVLVRSEGERKAVFDDELERVLDTTRSVSEQSLALVERYETLAESKEDLELSSRLQNEYLGALGEELREPLVELEDTIGLLGRSDLDLPQRELIRRADDSRGQLRDLVERCRQLGSIFAGEGPEVGRFDLRRLIEGVHRRHAGEAGGRDLRCVLEDSVPAVVQADPLRLRQLLDDLWRAAIDLSPRGRITLRVRSVTRPDSPADLRFLFSFAADGADEALLRSANFPRRPVAGEDPGLGLAVCRELAEMLGGQLGIERERGTMTLWLNVTVEPVNRSWDGRRTHRRLSQESVQSSLGRVLDLSLGGMRIECTRAPHGEIEVELRDDEETMNLRATVAWSRRLGFGKHEAGLRFVALDAEAACRLSALAARNRLRCVMEG